MRARRSPSVRRSSPRCRCGLGIGLALTLTLTLTLTLNLTLTLTPTPTPTLTLTLTHTHALTTLQGDDAAFAPLAAAPARVRVLRSALLQVTYP